MSNNQLSLGLALSDHATFDNYTPGHNQSVFDALIHFSSSQDEHFIYLCGPHGSGRTHLLQATCQAAHDVNQTAMYLPLGSGEFGPDIFEGMEAIRLVCLDDVDAVLGDRQWEEALFHFYNRAQSANTQLLVSAKQLPSQLSDCLPDLRSRLCWGLVFQLSLLSDQQKLQAMQMRAKRRGFNISAEVGDFLLRHYPRDTHALFTLLDCLDRCSLQAQRKITVPFVKTVIEEGQMAGWL